jgi:hypothetical protein
MNIMSLNASPSWYLLTLCDTRGIATSVWSFVRRETFDEYATFVNKTENNNIAATRTTIMWKWQGRPARFLVISLMYRGSLSKPSEH